MPKAPLLLRGKTAVITGAGSGIGRALAVEASRRGMAVALVGRRTAALEETRSLLGLTAACLIIPGDITSATTRFAVRDRVARDWGVLHVLVNNAGIVAAGPLREAHDADLLRMMTTNLLAPIAITRDLLPLLQAGSPARVVNIGSLVGDVALPLFAVYSASKFGLRGLSNALRRELKGLGIGVTYVAPRGARTDATQQIALLIDALAMPLDEPMAIAVQVWDSVARGNDSLYPRSRERLYVLFERLFPSIVTRALTAQFERAGFGPISGPSAPPLPRAAGSQPQTPQSQSAYDGS